MMSVHTRGPWILTTEPTNVEGVNVRFSINSHTHISICNGQSQEYLKGGIWEDECKANARLIASAPDLLRELVNARRELAALHQAFIATVTNQATGLIEDQDDILTVEADQDMINGIDAAIAKATGEQP